MIIDGVKARNKVEALLTDEQRKQLQDNGGGYGMGYGMGMGMGMGMMP